jgi:hypothetical protein
MYASEKGSKCKALRVLFNSRADQPRLSSETPKYVRLDGSRADRSLECFGYFRHTDFLLRE